MPLFDFETMQSLTITFLKSPTPSVPILIAADVDGVAGVALSDANIVLKLALGIPVEVASPAKASAYLAVSFLQKKLAL